MATNETFNRLMDAAGAAGADQDLLADAEWRYQGLNTQARDWVVAFYSRQNWGDAQKGQELAQYLYNL